MMLRPHLPIEPDESMMSWATRLAAVHAGETLIPFLRDICLHPDEMLKGSLLAVARLAEVTGADPNDIRHQSIRTLEWRRYDLRGELFEAEFLKGSVTSFCPACLLDDDCAGPSMTHRRGRLMWRLRPVRTCAVHGTSLIDRHYVDWSDRFHQMGVVVPETGKALEALVEAGGHREVSPLQKYVTERLNGARGPAWLDGQSIEQGARATEILGVALVFGRKLNLNKMSAHDWERAAIAGFEFTESGEEGVRAALSELQHRAWFQEKVAGNSGPQMIFGRLYQWLNFSKNEKDVGPIRQILRQHIMETMSVAAGTRLLGDEVRKNTMHSVASLSSKSGVHPKTLRNALALTGLVPKDAGTRGHHVFDASAGEALVEQLRGAIPQTRLPAYMNATRGQVVTLMQSGILEKIVGGGSGTRLAAAVAKATVDAFLDSIARDAREVADLPALVVPINKAAIKSRVTTERIIDLLRGRCLENVFRLRGTSGYLAIHVDPTEIKGHFVTDPEDRLMSMSAVAKAIGTSNLVVRNLVSTSHGEPLLIAASFSPGGVPKVRPQELRRFLKTYVTLVRLCRERGIHHFPLKRALRRIGVKPVRDPKLLKISLYRRAEIPADLDEGQN